MTEFRTWVCPCPKCFQVLGLSPSLLQNPMSSQSSTPGPVRNRYSVRLLGQNCRDQPSRFVITSFRYLLFQTHHVHPSHLSPLRSTTSIRPSHELHGPASVNQGVARWVSHAGLLRGTIAHTLSSVFRTRTDSHRSLASCLMGQPRRMLRRPPLDTG